MTLIDNENGRAIVNPYITLYDPGQNTWVALNTETFGTEAQDRLIHPLDESRMESYIRRESPLFKIVATVGKQNYPIDHENVGTIMGRGVRMKGADDALALVPLGYLPKSVIQEQFPKSFEYFEAVKKEKDSQQRPERSGKRNGATG